MKCDRKPGPTTREKGVEKVGARGRVGDSKPPLGLARKSGGEASAKEPVEKRPRGV